MTKLKNLAENFLQKSQGTAPMRSQPINPFHSLFQIQDLNEKDDALIDQILLEGHLDVDEESFAKDLVQIKRITKELKAIQRQEIVLIGERIFQARQIFTEDKYEEESFKKWLEFTFGSFKSGYNYLAFYKLYLELPDQVKGSFKEMPAKAAYILASKSAPIDQKVTLIQSHADLSASEIILAIQETFGEKSSKSRRSSTDQKLNIALRCVDILMKKRSPLNSEQRKKALLIISGLKKVLNRQ